MKSIPTRFILVLTTIIAFSSCTKLIIGMNGIKEVDEATITKFGDKYKIPSEDSYELDTSYYSFLFSLDTAKYKSQIKNHYQPLQALYYNNGDLESFQVNCYAGGFPNLHWERDSIMTSFPPGAQAPPDSILSLSMHLNYLQPLSYTKEFSSSKYDYVVVVYWSRFMGRQSERFIEIIQENQKLSGDLKVKMVYVNTDNFFASNLTN